MPAGFTWDRVTLELGVCSPPGTFAFRYHVEAPADGLTVCAIPSGFTFDRVTSQLGVCAPGNFAYSHLLKAR